MKKLVFLCVLSVFVCFASAELYQQTYNMGFENGMDGWSSWGSGSGSGPSGSMWTQHWAYLDTTGNAHGGQNFMVVDADLPVGYKEYWYESYDVIWQPPFLDWTSTPGTGFVTIGAWMKDVTGNAEGYLELDWVDASGDHAGHQGGDIIPSIPTWSITFDVTTDWAYYEYTVPVPDGAFGAVPVYGVWGVGSVGLDDLYNQWVPEPMSIGLLGLGAFVLRKKRG